MQDNSKIDRIEFEVIGKLNPLQINLGGVGHVVGVDIEQFDHQPVGTPASNYIGINLNGLKGKYNKNGIGINTVKTIPFINNRFSFNDTDSDNTLKLGTGDSQLNFTFVSKLADDTAGSNSNLVSFDNNYLFNFSCLVVKY